MAMLVITIWYHWGSVSQMRTMVLEYESQHFPEQNHPDL